MTSMYITKPAFCNLSIALPQRSNYVCPPIKLSRICFTSATNYPKGRKLYSSNNADVSTGEEKKTADTYDKTLETMGRALDETKDKAYEMKERMKERVEDLKVIANEMGDLMAEKTEEAKDAKKKMEAMHEKNVESAGSMAEMAAEEAKDRAVGMAEDANGKMKEMREKTMESAGSMGGKTKEYAENTKKSVEEVIQTVAENAQKMGDIAKQNVQDAWDANNDTTKKVKITLVQKSDD